MVKGIVKNITDYGAFVDLGGIDGLLHITDLAWRRVKHPSEMLTVGDEVEAKVLKFDQEKNRVSLGMKQLGEDPWVGLSRRYPPGTRLFGKVTNLTDYGAFVEIEPGIEGLVHVSEMDWTNKNVHPSKVVQLGDEVEVMVLEIDEDRRRISLGMKQCMPNPWEEFAMNHKKGDKVKGQIKSITDFGIFIGLPGGIDGLVHLSDLSWSLPGEEAVRNYKKGEEVEAVVLVDRRRARAHLARHQAARRRSVQQLHPGAREELDRDGHGEVDRRQGRRDPARRRRRGLPAGVRSGARPRRGHPHAAEGRRHGHGDDHQHRSQEPHDQPVDQGQGHGGGGRGHEEACRRTSRRAPAPPISARCSRPSWTPPILNNKGGAMTKSELIAKLAARYPQLVAKDAELAVKMILDAMAKSLAQGQRIEIRGFGSFGLNYRPPRTGRNPKSGEKVQVPAKYVPHFKAGKELRERVDIKK